ncbi:MAG: 16S rRNA (cytosine(1402)-N(4))-methyltransferase RsmH [Candidatus Pacebacteria bacterium]|jgi:16S rRNA (cytosine1402-N4)-methyltransferase|nr:16S rRNA (cytosine(1402)-N(4))-methyltransferase RsmH [Candidatus Paceibacterota bacterium]
MQHITVLQHEAVQALALNPASVVVDATLGAGGHARVILDVLDATGTYIGIDADAEAVEAAKVELGGQAKKHLVVGNFSSLDEILTNCGITQVDAVLADLGWRTDQFTAVGRGFSFSDEAGLLMTYGRPEDYAFTAKDIVNDWAEEDIANVIYGYGEEHYSRRIAKAIVEYRAHTPIETAAELARIISDAVPAGYRRGKINPATKSFQGLRIAVNDEFSVLETFIATAFTKLKPDGRLAIISFHSLEDRIVKLAFKAYTHDQKGVLVTKKPIVASEAELKANPRARSAKLRIIQKLS